VAEAIRHDHSDRPEMEMEDARGGTALGKQRAASRSWLTQEREKERFEEELLLLLRGMREKNTATKRQSTVVISNMAS
jgi:hypothetical protein